MVITKERVFFKKLTGTKKREYKRGYRSQVTTVAIRELKSNRGKRHLENWMNQNYIRREYIVFTFYKLSNAT